MINLFIISLLINTPCVFRLGNGSLVEVKSWRQTGDRIEFIDNSGELFTIHKKLLTMNVHTEKKQIKKPVQQPKYRQFVSKEKIKVPESPVFISTRSIKEYAKTNSCRFQNTTLEIPSTLSNGAEKELQDQKKLNKIYKDKLGSLATHILDLQSKEKEIKRKLFMERNLENRNMIRSELMRVRETIQKSKKKLQVLKQSAIKKGAKIRD